MQEIIVKSSIDNTSQPSLFHYAGDNKPLLVGLHTWSHGRDNQIKNMLPYAEKYGWSLLLPEFRGANLIENPKCREACASNLAIGDIFDAIGYVCKNYKIDEEKIFMLGLSGGGHMSLMTVAKRPELFRAVGAFVPITDMKAWHSYNKKYAPHIEACLGGSPEDVGDEIYKERSPISYIEGLSRANLKIFHGKFDPVVPFMQSVNLYNTICKDYPKSRVFLDIFDGGHEIDMQSAFYWFESQLNGTNLTAVTG